VFGEEPAVEVERDGMGEFDPRSFLEALAVESSRRLAPVNVPSVWGTILNLVDERVTY